jgi:hypothetical protein
MTPPSLFAELDLSDDQDDIRAAHRRAIVHGVEVTRTEAHCEAHALMCVAIEPLLTVATVGESYQSHVASLGDPSNPLLASQLRRLRDASAGSVLLLSRALDSHASDTGRDPGAWQDDVVRAASTVIAGRGRPSIGEVARSAILEVSSALLRIAHSRMVVPRHLATAIGRLTAVYLLAEELLARSELRSGRVADAPRGWEGLIPAGSWPQLMISLRPRERAELHGVLLGLPSETRFRVVEELLAQTEWMSFGTAMLVALFRAGGPTAAAQGRYAM